MTLRKGILFTTSLILSSISIVQLANAKANYPAGQPLIYNNAIGCTSCHSGTPQTENNANTSYGILFGNAYDDDRGTLASAYLSLEQWDIDRDGFSNGQELRQASGFFNSSASTPALTTPNINAGNVMAKAVDGGGAVTTLSVTGTSFLNDITTFEKPAIANAVTTTTFMYTFGGMQAGATATFYNENNVPMAANTADGSYTTNLIPTDTTLDGSMNILVKDDGVFDLYSEAAFIRIAKARVPTFIPVINPASINPYATIDPYAKISPTATIDNYAVVDAYAIVDNYAVIGPYAQVRPYAYIAPNVSVNGTATGTKAIIDPYVNVTTNIATAGTTALPNAVGYVQAKFSISTTAPAIPSIVGGGGDDDGEGGDSAGGLHCMTTSGLGLQGLMFLSLFGTAYLFRRKKK